MVINKENRRYARLAFSCPVILKNEHGIECTGKLRDINVNYIYIVLDQPCKTKANFDKEGIFISVNIQLYRRHLQSNATLVRSDDTGLLLRISNSVAVFKAVSRAIVVSVPNKVQAIMAARRHQDIIDQSISTLEEDQKKQATQASSKQSKINCWDYFKCGREAAPTHTKREFGKGGTNNLGSVCSVSITQKYHGFNSGINSGRYCWKIQGSYCPENRGSIDFKEKNCDTCEFKKLVQSDEGFDFQD